MSLRKIDITLFCFYCIYVTLLCSPQNIKLIYLSKSYTDTGFLNWNAMPVIFHIFNNIYRNIWKSTCKSVITTFHIPMHMYLYIFKHFFSNVINICWGSYHVSEIQIIYKSIRLKLEFERKLLKLRTNVEIIQTRHNRFD